jgi:hypothetical protein
MLRSMVKRIFSGSLNTEQTPLQVREPPYNLNASTGFHRFHRLRTLFQNPKLVDASVNGQAHLQRKLEY